MLFMFIIHVIFISGCEHDKYYLSLVGGNNNAERSDGLSKVKGGKLYTPHLLASADEKPILRRSVFCKLLTMVCPSLKRVKISALIPMNQMEANAHQRMPSV